MTSQAMDWDAAIVKVLQDAGQPLHYQTITGLIGELGLRELSGATPATTVSSRLGTMINPEHGRFDRRIRKTSRGVFEFVDPSDTTPEPEPEQEIDESDEAVIESSDRIIGVPAYGLYWEKDKVNWGRGSSGILGRQAAGSSPVDFSGQHGVYLLHKDRAVIYVGRTTDSLRGRLDNHNKDKKAPRWNRFSWFGFRNVISDDDGNKLEDLPSEIDTQHLVTILESVLIEALEPPVNGRRGDYMGVLYEQVPDPEIQRQDDIKLRRMMSESLSRI